MEEKDKQPEQSEDVQAHIRDRALQEDESTDEQGLRRRHARGDDGEEDVEAHIRRVGK